MILKLQIGAAACQRPLNKVPSDASVRMRTKNDNKLGPGGKAY